MEILLAASSRNPGQTKVIYTSGTWVFGKTDAAPVQEPSKRTPIATVKWRPALEDRVLAAGGIVLRPGVVYGRRQGLTAEWFNALDRGGEITLVGSAENRWAMVHVEDLAQGYVLAAELGEPGTAYNFVDDGKENVRQMVAVVVSAATMPVTIRYLPLPEATVTMGEMAEAYALDQYISTDRTCQALGWVPLHPSLVRELKQAVEV